MSFWDDLAGIGQQANAVSAAPSAGGPPPAPAQPPAGLMIDPNAAPAETPKTGVAGFFQRLLPQPAGYRGLLSDEDMSHARKMAGVRGSLSLLADSSAVSPEQPAPGLGAAIGRAGMNALGGFDQSMQGDLAARGQGLQARQGENILRVRQQVAQQYPPQPGETQQQMLERMGNVEAALGLAGDYAGAKAISEGMAPLRMARSYASMGQVQYKPVNTGGFQTIQRMSDGMYRNPVQPDETAPDAWVPFLQKTDTADHKAETAAHEAGATARAGQATVNHDDSMDSRVIQQFQTRNAKDIELMHNMGGVAALLDQADKGDPYSLQALPGAISSVLDSKARSGPFLLEKLSQFGGPSLVGKIQNAVSTGAYGTITSGDRGAIRQAVTAVYGNRKAHLDADYGATIGKRPGSIAMGGTPQSMYGVPQFDGQAAPAPAAGVAPAAAGAVAPVAPAAAKNGVDIRTLIR